jgi:hypothetical protein
MKPPLPANMREAAEARDALNYAFPSEELKTLRRIEKLLTERRPVVHVPPQNETPPPRSRR